MVALALALASCSETLAIDPTPTQATKTVRGAIQSVEARSLLELETVVIVDESGKNWTFEARGKKLPSFTPSHLNEHKVLGLPVTVSYHREGEILVLDNITD